MGLQFIRIGFIVSHKITPESSGRLSNGIIHRIVPALLSHRQGIIVVH